MLFVSLVCLYLTGRGDATSAALVEKANALYKEKNYKEAVKAYSEAIEADSRNVKLYVFRGLATSMTGDWKGCIADLDKGAALDPKNLEVLATRAFARLQTDEFDLAKKDFAAMDEIEKDAGQKARFGLAQKILRRARNNLMSKDGDKSAALADYNRVLAIAPANDIILFERGCAHSDLKDYKSALADFDRVIKIDGDTSKFGDSHRQRARVRKALGDEKGAKEDEEEAGRRSNRNP